MISRRDWLRITAGAGAALGLGACGPEGGGNGAGTSAANAPGTSGAGGAGGGAATASGAQQGEMILRTIPSSGDRIPVIGLGGRWISADASQEELAAHREVLRILAEGAEGAGRVFDTAYGYGGGGSEEYAGDWAREDGFADDIFWATKVNVAPRGGGPADPEEARAQIERSFDRLHVDVIDLDQVHNMGDPPTQLGILQEYKDEGRIRHIGITTTFGGQYEELARVMRDYPLDFIGIDYAIDNRVAEEEIFPIAQDEGIAVMVYLPFGRSRMWERIGDRPVPGWASEFDASTWAQFMLKFVVAHPAVTVVTPGTGDPEHMLDNLGGGRGRLPTEEHLERMIALVEELPPA
ncbi:MAG: aldo/keto reductase [Longimicrobiales bacterium]|nr:aldo/keto reductase [Longimicrobiales bacterium]